MHKILLGIGLALSQLAIAQDTARIDASLSTATVYFGYGAELTHQAKVPVTAATRFIVINKLSTSIDLSSLQISCPEDVALLSHKFSVFYPNSQYVEAPKWQTQLEDSITRMQNNISKLKNTITIEQETLGYSGKIIEQAVANSGTNLNSSAELLKLVDFHNAKIEKSKTAIYNHEQTIAALNKKIADARVAITKMQQETGDKSLPYGQLVLQVMNKKGGEIPLSLSYYTANAGWTPVYDVRVNSKTNKMKLVYKASVTQNTGINWRNTKLTLSTGTPNFGVMAPVLSPWHLQLYVPGLYSDLQRRAMVANSQRNMLQSYAKDEALSEVVVSGYGLKNKELEFKKQSGYDTVAPATIQDYTTLNEGQLNTNFEIDLPYDIQSDGQIHNVTIKDEEINSILKNYGVPRVDKDAYLLAEIANWQNLDLLPGEANIIMDDTYIGKSQIDPNSTADTLNLSLGRDRRVAIKRSLIKELSSLKTSGKDSRQQFTYEVVVKNNKLTDVNLLLKDQFPLSGIKEVEVKLDEDGGASVNEETGVLTWKMDLKPGESKKIRFSYTVKYPKDKRIVNLK
jgi:uncharacterized protein (TIGR02231 family)